jgi:two-component system, NtrC family, response regulator AtoC
MVTDRVIDILVIEDEMNASLLTDKIKNEFQDNVRIHKNGKGITGDLAMIKDLDLVIVDQQYSKENIVDALKTIRKRSPYTEVIVLSSENETREIDSIKKAGAYDFIYKDRSALDKVIYVIRAFWSNKKLQSENIKLRTHKKKSTGTIVLMILVILAVIAGGIYLLTR